MLDEQRNDARGRYDSFLHNAGNDLNDARTNSRGLRNTIQERYTNSNNFMPEGMKPNSSGWFDLPEDKSSGAGSGDFAAARGGYSKLAETGGVNRADFNPALDSYKGFMSHGGVDATALRQRATGQIPSFYDAYKRNAQRRSNVQGGYSPGFDEQQAEIGREAGRAGFEASRQVEGDIADKVQQGKMFGTTGYGGLMSNITGMEQQGKIAGLGGLTNIGQTEASLGESRASRNQQMQLALQRMFQEGGMESNRGLQNLYSSRSGEMDQGLDAWLRGMGQRSQNDLGNLGMRAGMTQGKNWGEILSRIAGYGGMVLGGFGGGSSPNKNQMINDAYRNDGTVMA